MNRLPNARRLAWALVLAMPLWLGSCTKNSDDSVSPTSVTGNYKLTALNVVPKIEGFDDLLPVYALFIGTTCLSDITLSFKSNGVVFTDRPTTCQSVSSDIIDDIGIDDNSKWVSAGTTVTITTGTGEVTVYEVTFSGRNMQLKWQEDATDGNGKAFKQGFTMALKRV